MNKIRIALIGPESTGKTTLAMQLAEHYGSAWIPEYSRGYVENLKRRYSADDVIYCAEKQMESEELAKDSQGTFLFADTELINCKVWLKDVFGSESRWIEQMITGNPYELYLLTKPDIPFAEDRVRENPHRRDFFFDWYKRELDAYQFNYRIITGSGDDRLLNATGWIDEFMLNRQSRF
jgi:NadR type nicotinamide-nucleotide adenylyltransferase